MDLENKVILVTGGSGLLGAAYLKSIKKAGGIGINVDITVKTDLTNLTYQCDVTNDSSIQQLVHDTVKEFGRIDGLVNNAYPRTKDWGLALEDEELDLSSWRKNVDLQLNSYVSFCQKVVKQMKKQNSGAIVNIASIYGVVGNDLTVYEGTPLAPPPAYTAIKGGLINFTRYLASFYGKYNIRVNCVSPGGIFDNQHPVFVKNYEHKVPMKRMGTPEDIAPSVTFLLSDNAQYITGQNLIVDGGWTAI